MSFWRALFSTLCMTASICVSVVHADIHALMCEYMPYMFYTMILAQVINRRMALEL